MTVKYKTNDDYMLREIAGEAVLVPIGEDTKIQNAMINLNETSAYLWKFFAEPHTVEEGIAKVKEEYEAPDGEIERDVTLYIRQGLPLGLFVEVKE